MGNKIYIYIYIHINIIYAHGLTLVASHVKSWYKCGQMPGMFRYFLFIP